jgi:hypothetical protein
MIEKYGVREQGTYKNGKTLRRKEQDLFMLMLM